MRDGDEAGSHFGTIHPHQVESAKLVELATRMLKLHKDLPKAGTAPDKTVMQKAEGEGITDRTSVRG